MNENPVEPKMRREKALAVIIVTFNRCDELKVTLRALSEQKLDHLIVVDNASTDKTPKVISEATTTFGSKLRSIRLAKNTGGAGGFNVGVREATKLDVDWIWISDDDAIPQKQCLHNILDAANNPEYAYGSIAIENGSDDTLCWPARTVSETGAAANQTFLLKMLRDIESVESLSFLGMMVSKKKALEIGPPNPNYFISGDDIEYSIRLKQSGAKLILVKSSTLKHPSIPRHMTNLFGKEIYNLTMPPWRRYYDVRNRIWNARLQGGLTKPLATTSSILIKAALTLIREPEKLKQVKEASRGLFDGWLKYGESRNF